MTINAADIIHSGTPILFVTLDSLRYDVATTALDEGRTPHLARLLPGGQWERRWTPGTFTLPAHMAFFSGFLPKLPTPQQPPRLWECRPPAFKTVHPRTFHGQSGGGEALACVAASAGSAHGVAAGARVSRPAP